MYLITAPGLAPHPAATAAPLAFRAFSRPPVGSAWTLPFIESEPGPDNRFFVHPDSILEFALDGSEHEVRGSLGIAPGAYDRPGKTDGVDFAIEFLGADGRRERLYHRYLNPADETDDRGTPAFAITLPENPRGRLLLRSFNPHYRNAAWDWAFWRDVVIE